MIEWISHSCKQALINETINALQSKLLAESMGVCESFCLPLSDSGELQLVFYEDQAVGKLLRLTKEQKEEYWDKIKEAKFYEGIQNKLFPLAGRKDVGLIYFPNKYLYQGDLKEETPDGVGRVNLFSEKLTVEGTFKNGKVDGQCVFTFSEQKVVIKGKWSKGIPNKIEIKSQKRRYTLQFQGQKLEQTVLTFPNMSQYRGSLRYDPIEKMHITEGKGTLTYENGDILVGNFVNGYLQGEGEFKWGDSRYSYRGTFNRGLFNGHGQCDLGDKGLLKITWKDNKPHGMGTLTYDNIDYPVYYENGVRLEKMSDVSE